METYISVQFEDEQELFVSIKAVQDAGIKIYDVFTPFPVHGLDKALKLGPSKIATVGFISGVFGTMVGFLFQTWTSTVAWPLNIGGKPSWAVPSFIPVAFETTVLFAVLGMIIAFLYKSKLFPGRKNKIYHEGITDDFFVMILDYDKDISEAKKQEIEQLLYEAGAYNIDFVENSTIKL